MSRLIYNEIPFPCKHRGNPENCTECSAEDILVKCHQFFYNSCLKQFLPPRSDSKKELDRVLNRMAVTAYNSYTNVLVKELLGGW